MFSCKSKFAIVWSISELFGVLHGSLLINLDIFETPTEGINWKNTYGTNATENVGVQCWAALLK